MDDHPGAKARLLRHMEAAIPPLVLVEHENATTLTLVDVDVGARGSLLRFGERRVGMHGEMTTITPADAVER